MTKEREQFSSFILAISEFHLARDDEYFSLSHSISLYLSSPPAHYSHYYFALRAISRSSSFVAEVNRKSLKISQRLPS